MPEHFDRSDSPDCESEDLPLGNPQQIRALLRAAQELGRQEGRAAGRQAYEAQIQRHEAQAHEQQTEIQRLRAKAKHDEADIHRLETKAEHYEAEIKRLEARAQLLYEQITTARRRMFGPSSETSTQARLFNEVDALSATAATAPDAVDLPAAPAEDEGHAAPKDKSGKPRGKRRPISPDVPRVDIVHELPEDQRLCPCCGKPMVEIGEDVSEQLDIVPMRFRVLRHRRKRYACPGSDHSAPKAAPAPLTVLPKCNATASTIAILITAKFVDGQPLARLEYVTGRFGVVVPRQTSARWMIRVALEVLMPLLNLVRDTLLEGQIIHMDETTVQVLKEPGKTAQSNSYMWVACGGTESKRVVLFDYDPSRAGAVPLRLLSGWSGYLMTDGYEGYNKVVAAQGIEHLACWAHVRRRFVDAAKLQPKGKKGLADEAVAMIGELYRIEREAAGLDDAARWQLRLQRSRPQLQTIRAWLDRTLPSVPPKLALGQALVYMDGYWPKLVRYVERGDLPADNNRCENAIRPFVVGRKGWLFADTQAGAQASAVLYSLIETAKANGREPYLWLRHVLERIPMARTADDFDALLPWNFHPLHSTS